jgi:hypothetical protein
VKCVEWGSMRRTYMSYSPKIKGDLIRRLYQLKQKEKRPMTRLVNEAVIEYLEKKEKDNDEEKQRYI